MQVMACKRTTELTRCASRSCLTASERPVHDAQSTALHVVNYILQDDIWQSIQQSIRDHTGHGLPDDTTAQHYMQQLLAPGNLCQQALSHALLELEEPLSRYNASNEEVLQHLTAAAQVHLLYTMYSHMLLH